MNTIVKDFLDLVESNNKGESEFLQADVELLKKINIEGTANRLLNDL